MAALRIIIEQSLEWNSSLFLKFVDFEKTFDSLDREDLWNLMAHYGIPQKFINIIRHSYNNMQCRVIHEGKLTESFDVKQGCLLLRNKEEFHSNDCSIIIRSAAI
jgi:hypothetical protein